jgi:predicted RNA-binding Zn ribbon-like protein
MTEKLKRTDFSFLSGHTCLDFVNTQPSIKGQPIELLQTFDDFARWLTRAGLLDGRASSESLRKWSDGPEGEKITERARAFREALRRMIDAVSQGSDVPTEHAAAINFILAENDGNLRLERHGNAFRMRFAARPTQPIALLGGVAEAAAELLCRNDLKLIRRCANPECNFYFYDATRNHRRQWCAMATCGNLMKVRAFRKRHRQPAMALA